MLGMTPPCGPHVSGYGHVRIFANMTDMHEELVNDEEIPAGNLMVGTAVNLVQGLIGLSLIKDPLYKQSTQMSPDMLLYNMNELWDSLSSADLQPPVLNLLLMDIQDFIISLCTLCVAV